MKSFLIALQFLTRFHVAAQTVWSNEDFGRAVLFFPLVGLVIGAFLSAVWYGLSYILAPFYGAVVLTGAWFFITGGLHADGFMDTADGLFSNRDREKMLEILKDSRVGSNAVMAFFFLGLLKITFLAAIAPAYVMTALVSIPVAARFTAVLSILTYDYARPQGLGKAFQEYAPKCTLPAAFVLALLPAAYTGWGYGLILGMAILFNLWANGHIVKKLGGLTGDTYGAVIESTELVLLAIMAVVSQLP